MLFLPKIIFGGKASEIGSKEPGIAGGSLPRFLIPVEPNNGLSEEALAYERSALKRAGLHRRPEKELRRSFNIKSESG